VRPTKPLLLIAIAARFSVAEETHVPWGNEIDGYKLSLRSPQAVFQCREAIKLTIVLKNVSSKNGWFSSVKVPEIDYPARVLYSSAPWIPLRQAVPLTSEGVKRTDLRRLRGGVNGLLPANGEASAELELASVYDMRLPGQYTVSVFSSVSREGTAGRHRIESNQVDLVIEPCK